MAQATVNFRIDADLKKGLEKVCKELGLSATTAYTMFASAVVREQRIPLNLSLNDPFYSAENMKRLKESINQMETQGGIIHEVLDD